MPTINANQSSAKRVPITMSGDEIDALQALARENARSAASMARIIYLEGLKAYALTNKKRGRR
jgi:hypothetical protein